MIRPELVHPGAAARGLRAVRRPGKSPRGSRSCGPLAADDSRGQANAARDLSVITAGTSQAKNSAADG
jgi:hypothetical protein